MQAFYNPYSGQDFFGFFITLIQRFFSFFSGKLTLGDLASDEIQVLVLILVSASAAMVGTFLVLRRMTMLANSISHTILLGIVIAYILTGSGKSGHLNLQAMLLASMGMGLLTAFLTEFLSKTGKLQEDASTGIVFTTLFAIGIIAVTFLTRSAHIGVEAVMGNVDALQLSDLKLIFVILVINTLLFALFFKEFKITTFDPLLAKTFGISAVFFNYLLMMQVSATTIGAFRAVGVLMVLAFISGPPLSARLLTHDLKKMIWAAVTLGSLASLLGVAISRHLLTVYEITLSTGGVVVCVIVFLFAVSVIASRFQKRKKSTTPIQQKENEGSIRF